jgi:4-amino-4-deoxy-L-arabinose transferase-like glycosyltransferase
MSELDTTPMGTRPIRWSRRSPHVWLGVAIALSFLLRLPFLTVPLISDEGGYAYAAQRWFDGRGELYRDLVFDRPQGIFVTYGVIEHTLGTSVVAIRLGAWLAAAATLIVVWSFARRVEGDGAAGLAAILFAVLVGSPVIEGFTANAEVFMGLPAAGCAWLLLRASRNRWRGSSLLTAGLLAGTATLIKQSGIVMLPLGLAFVLLYAAPSVRPLARRWAWFGTGFALAVAPALLHGWAIGWDDYVTAVGGRLQSHSGATITPEAQLLSFEVLFARTWPILVPVVLLLYTRARRGLTARHQLNTRMTPELRYAARWPVPRPGSEAGVLLGLWLAACCAGIAMGGNWFPHYLSQVIAPLAIWLGVMLVRLLDSLPARARWELAIPLAAVLLFPYGIVATCRANPDLISQKLFDRVTYPPQDEIAAYVRAHTSPETPIYVAFYQTSIYYLADRPASYRHLYGWELQAIPTAEDELATMVESPARPRYIIDLHQVSPFPDGGTRFWGAVAPHYHVETTIAGMTLYRANDA